MNFENLHRNKKLAFLDGFLCGIATSIIAAQFYKDYAEEKAARRRRETHHIQPDPPV